MSNTNTGGPAFPLSHSHKDLEGTNWQHANGMTLRDYFAAKAISELMRVYSFGNADPVEDYANEIARDAYSVADAMLKARSS